MGHQAPKDLAFDELAIAGAGHLLDDRSQQHIVRVAVVGLGPGSKRERLVLEHVDQCARGEILTHPLRPQRSQVVLDARGVRQQILDRDLRPAGRVVGQEFRYLVGQGQLALLGQLHDRRGRELLGDRAETKHHVGPDGHVQFQVGQAVTLPEDHLPVLHHDDRGSGR
jgi:hypothetical protein